MLLWSKHETYPRITLKDQNQSKPKTPNQFKEKELSAQVKSNITMWKYEREEDECEVFFQPCCPGSGLWISDFLLALQAPDISPGSHALNLDTL